MQTSLKIRMGNGVAERFYNLTLSGGLRRLGNGGSSMYLAELSAAACDGNVSSSMCHMRNPFKTINLNNKMRQGVARHMRQGVARRDRRRS